MRLVTSLLAVSTLGPNAALAAVVPVTVYYVDLDGDGFGSGDGIESTAPEPDWVTIDGDCLPRRATGHPGANEICDGFDNDCDGMVDDDDDSVDRSTFHMFWSDADDDGYGANAVNTRACQAPPGYVTLRDDCADDDAAVHPRAPEYCDGKDNDCDRSIDDGALSVDWYRDRDGDGFGTRRDVQTACEPVDGYVRDGGDCDDRDVEIGPHATDICVNGVDEDCDGVTDNCTIDDLDFVLYPDARHFELGAGLITPDLDGDGVADLVATYDTGLRGGAFGVFGPVTGTQQTADANVTLRSDREGECIRGWAVSAGDANGDGFDDLLVGAPCVDTTYLMLGPITGNRGTDRAEAAFFAEDFNDSSLLTTGISPDVDGDGTPDVLIAVPLSDENRGNVYVASAASSGTVDLSADATYRFDAEGYSDTLGRDACDDIGDMNGDGITDLAIGSQGAGTGGKVYVVEGGASPGTYDVDAAAAATVTGTGDSSQGFGSVVTAADYDGDGTSDLIVGGDQGSMQADPDAGSVFAFLGPLTADATAGDADTTWFSHGLSVYDRGGLAVGGDVDDDGSADMIVGAYTHDGGAVFVQLGWVTGSILLTDLPSIRALGRYDLAGWSVAFLGDWSGDGGDEIATGAPSARSESGHAGGAVYVAFSDRLF